MDKRYYYEVSVQDDNGKEHFTGYLIAETYSQAQEALENHMNLIGYDDDEITSQMMEHVDADDIMQLQIEDIREDFDTLREAVEELFSELNISEQDLVNRTTPQGISNRTCQNLLDALNK